MLQMYWPKTDEENGRWGATLGKLLWPTLNRPIENCQTAIVFEDDEVRCIIAYYNWDPEAGVIEISAHASGRWLTRPVLRSMYDYAFQTAGCQMVVQRNEPDNVTLNAILKRLNFKRHYIARLLGRGKGQLVFTLTDDDWYKHPINAKEQSHVRQEGQRTKTA